MVLRKLSKNKSFFVNRFKILTNEDEVVLTAPESVVSEASLGVSPGVLVHHASPGLPLITLVHSILTTTIRD